MNLSRAELGRELGVDRSTVYRWEEGQRDIPPFLFLALRQLATDLENRNVEST